MIELKVECDCGQNYKFEVEPIQGRMPFRVNCPACGGDGTQKANLLLQQTEPLPVVEPVAAPPSPIAPPPVPAAMRLATAPASAVTPPPIPAAPIARPGALAARIPQPKGNDGWSKSETGLNKIGSYVMLTPSILGAMLAGGFFGLEVSPIILAIIVSICGIAGGAINILGRGPIFIGMLVGLTMALGGYGAVLWWISDKTSIRKYELAIAFLIGAAPGFGLQYVFQRIVLKRRQSADT